MRRPWRLAAIFLFVLATLAGGLAGNRLLALGEDAKGDLKLYTELLQAARARYGGEVHFRDLVYSSIHGMLRTLDPHTNFLPPTAYSSMREKQQATFFGLGILVGLRNGRLTVISPIDGTPASRLGIRAGDVIQRIEEESTDKLSIDEAVSRLKGPKGTQVHITILRAGLDEPLDLTVTRAEIPQTTVRYAYMIAPGTGYMSISDFTRSTGDEVQRALAKLKGEGMQRLLLDLRNNGGGLLDQAVDVADQFLPEGSTIVETRGRTRDSGQAYSADGSHAPIAEPVIVLVNSGTASAAEILSGGIQDHDIGLVVGTPTWGKGLVQTVYSLSYGAGLALTTAKYYTPSGRLIQRDYSSYFDYYTRNGLEPGDDAAHTKIAPPASQAYATDLGRKVYGGGGITPDVDVQPAEVAPFLQFLIGRSAFFGFGVDFARRHPEITRDWRPEPAVLDEFRTWVVGQKIDTAAELEKGFTAEPERTFALRQIRAEIFASRFGIEASHQVQSEGDAQIQAAMKLFPQAEAMLGERSKLAKKPDVTAAAPVRQ
ncbi:MAG: S41 family peptidase [Thermoanaerobaculia bacterium]